jgi:hypothetical protein
MRMEHCSWKLPSVYMKEEEFNMFFLESSPSNIVMIMDPSDKISWRSLE